MKNYIGNYRAFPNTAHSESVPFKVTRFDPYSKAYEVETYEGIGSNGRPKGRTTGAYSEESIAHMIERGIIKPIAPRKGERQFIVMIEEPLADPRYYRRGAPTLLREEAKPLPEVVAEEVAQVFLHMSPVGTKVTRFVYGAY